MAGWGRLGYRLRSSRPVVEPPKVEIQYGIGLPNSGMIGAGIGIRDSGAAIPVLNFTPYWLLYPTNGTWQDEARTIPAGVGDPVGALDDSSGNNRHAKQSVSSKRPIRQDTPHRVNLDKIDDNLYVNMPAATDVAVAFGTSLGTTICDMNLLSGNHNFLTGNGLYFPGNDLVASIAKAGAWSEAEKTNVLDYLVWLGAGRDYAGATSLQYWFHSANRIKKLDCSHWNTSSVTNMIYPFYACSLMTEMDMTGWDTSNVTSMLGFVRNCSALVSMLGTANWNVSNVTDLSLFAYNCRELINIDVSGWNPAACTTMNSMFRDCWKLQTLDLSNWNTSNCTNFGWFATTCVDLTNITINGGTGSPFSDSPCTDYTNAFLNCELNEQSVNDILVAIEAAGTSNGTLNMHGAGTGYGNAAPTGAGLTAKTALEGRGWTVTTN